MNRTLGVALLLLFLSPSQAQVMKLSETEHEPEEGLDSSPELNGVKEFFRLIAEKSEKHYEAYRIQFDKLRRNETTNSLLVRLKGVETASSRRRNEGLLDPFFQWVSAKKEEHYEEIQELKAKGKELMAKKLKKWKLLGVLEEFFGAETGLSILRVDSSKTSLLTAWMTILADADVEFVDLDMPVELFEGDDLLEGECNLGTDWGYRQVRADTAAEILGFEGDVIPFDEEVLVAVIDSGVDYSHPLLINKIWINEVEYYGEEGVDDDGNGQVDDIYGWNFASNNNDVVDTQGHGTHVAGIIAGEVKKRPRFSGVAPNARILPCRFTEGGDDATISAAIECMEYALENGAQVISNSWGGAGVYSLALEEAMIKAAERGVLQIAAAGNSAVNNDGPRENATFPASFDHRIIISVAAIDGKGNLTSTSNYGKTTTDLAAPGYSIVSTQLDGKLARMSGTSQATPFVTAAAALLMGACRHQRKECTPMQIKKALIRGVRKNRYLKGRVRSAGYLDIPRAARRLGLIESVSNDRDPVSGCNSSSGLRAFPCTFVNFILAMFVILWVII